jgi:hypothetical protein
MPAKSVRIRVDCGSETLILIDISFFLQENPGEEGCN